MDLEKDKIPDGTLAAGSEITRLLIRYTDGDKAVVEQLLQQVYQELRRLAAHYVSRERHQGTLQATVLVHEAYFRLIDQKKVEWKSRAHFFGLAANIMRRILVDQHRARNSQKRGGEVVKMQLDESTDAPDSSQPSHPDVVELDRALEKLALLEPRQAKVIELRYFGGLSIEDTAEVLQTSVATVKRDWTVARAWLFRELSGEE